MTTIAVHGAGGTQGTRIARQLRAAGHDVRPLDSSTAPLSHASSIAAAYEGVDGVVVMLPLEFGPSALTYAENIVAAVERSGVGQVVFNPALPIPPGPMGVPFVDARVLLAQRLPEVAGVASVVGPAGRYFEVFQQPWSVEWVSRTGRLGFPLPKDVRLPWLSLDDLGLAIADAFADPPPVRLVVGPEEVTGERIADAIAKAAGRDVRWSYVTPDEYRQLLTPILGAEAAAGVAAAYVDAGDPPHAPPVELIRRGSTTIEDWAGQQDWRP